MIDNEADTAVVLREVEDCDIIVPEASSSLRAPATQFASTRVELEVAVNASAQESLIDNNPVAGNQSGTHGVSRYNELVEQKYPTDEPHSIKECGHTCRTESIP